MNLKTRPLLCLRAALLLALYSMAASPLLASEPELTGRLYVSSWFGGVVSVIDLETNTLTATIPAGVQNHNVYLDPSRATAWVANNNDGTVTVIDTASNRPIRQIPVGAGPRHTFFSCTRTV